MSATTTFEMPIALDSLYIPRVYANITTEFIAETFENLDLGTVDRVEAVPRDGDNTSYMAFVYFSSWNTENKAAINLANRIKCPKPGENQARIVYDDPWFWILLPNKSEKKKEETELTSEETVDILYDMIEDLQTRLLESKKEHEMEMNKMKMELSQLREMMLFDPVPPSPPKLVRQIATGRSLSPIPIDFTRSMRSTIAKHIADGDNQLYEPDEKTEWFPTEEEVAEYKQDRLQRRMKDADNELKQVRVDGMGLVYPNNDCDNNFWCDP